MAICIDERIWRFLIYQRRKKLANIQLQNIHVDKWPGFNYPGAHLINSNNIQSLYNFILCV